MNETQNNHTFTNRAMDHRKIMDEIEAHVERQKKLDLANDFSFQEVRAVRGLYKSSHPFFVNV